MTRFQQVAALMQDGMTQREIAKELGLSFQAVHDAYQRAVAKGVMPQRRCRKPDNVLAHRGLRSGTMKDMLSVMPIDVVLWLCDITPPGATVGEVVAGIVKDAYADEVEDA